MGVLFFAPDIAVPSVLWMRRMLAGLKPDVARVITEKPPGEPWTSQYRCGVIPRGSGSFTQGVLRRLGLVQRRIASRAQTDWLAAQVAAPDVSVVLVHYANLALMYERAWQRTSKPIFVHCHGYDVTWDLRRFHEPERLVHPADYTARVVHLANRVQFIANSQTTRRRLLNIGVPEERIHIKYLGVPIPDQPFDRASKQRQPIESVNILYLGRLVDCKGPDRTIQAFSLACEQGLQGKLTMAGDGPLRAECERLRAESPFADRIEILGAVDEPTAEQLREEADVFTAHNQTGPRTRQEEAFGVSIVEAMGAALPVVSGNNGSLPELITDGQQGLLFPPGDIAAHAKALLKLARDPALRTKLGQLGRERAKSLFSIEQEMNTLRALLKLPAVKEPAA